jgi:Transglutaminase-like superfamily
MMVRLLRAARRRDLIVLLQAYVILLIVDLGIRAFGILPVWRLIRRRFREDGSTGLPDGAELHRLHRVVASAARYQPYPMRCLPLAVSLAWLLARRGFAVELQLGTRRQDGKLLAHAWLERAGIALFPAIDSQNNFRPLENGNDVLRTGEPRNVTFLTDGVEVMKSNRYAAKLYDLCVCSDLPLPGQTSLGGFADVELRRAPSWQSCPFEPGVDNCVYTNRGGSTAGKGDIEFHRHGEWKCLRSVGFTDFFFTDGRCVTYFLEDGASTDVTIAFFLGPICALLLELRGCPCLHASSIQVGAVAVALAGHSGTGKSSLAASMVNSGYPLLSDDILPMTVRGETCFGIPGYPQMKLNPETARAWLGLTESRAPVVPDSDKCWIPVGQGWGGFAHEAIPLQVVYVLDREPAQDGETRICHLGPAESLIELLRFSFCARLVERLGLQQRRLALLAKIVQRVQVRRLQFPSGLQHAGRIQAAILHDLDGNRLGSAASVAPT